MEFLTDNATQILRNDHKTLLGLFRQLETFPPDAPDDDHKNLLGQCQRELNVHSTIEKEIFYPALLDALVQYDDGAAAVKRGLQAHAEGEELINRLVELGHDSEQYRDCLQDFIETIELHMREEEEELFPKAQLYLKEDLPKLAERMSERKNELHIPEERPGARKSGGERKEKKIA